MPTPTFLDLPARTPKVNNQPRSKGITHVIEKGMGPRELEDWLNTCGQFVDIIKLGWSTAYITPNIKEKIAVIQNAGIPVYPGGTLFEIALEQGKVSDYCRWLETLGISMLEVSDGVTHLLSGEKREWIRSLSKSFTVVSEVGSKDPNVQYPPQDWAEWVERELDAGAAYVITEGREHGTSGIYDRSGTLNEAIIKAILERIPPEKVIFEVPVRKYQAWFIQTLGADVNLGNIAPSDVIGLETLRLNLRADTMITGITGVSSAQKQVFNAGL